MNKSRWILVVWMVATMMVISLVGAGCGPAETEEPAPEEEEPTPEEAEDTDEESPLIVRMEADPDTLDPHKSESIFDAGIVEQMMEALVDIDFEGTPQLLLAEDYEVLEEGQVWRFYLRDNVKYHNGAVMTADDVKYSIERAVDPDTAYPRRGRIDMIEEVEVVDNLTVDVLLRYPSATLLPGISAVPIIPKDLHLADSDAFAQSPVGTGPFKFKDWHIGEKVEVERFEDYWAGYPNLSGVVFLNIPESSVAALELEAGSIDVMYNLSPEDLARYEDDDSIHVDTIEGANYRTMALNNAIEPLDDVRVRQAINYGINREAIVDTVWPGTGTPAVGPFPRVSWAFSEQIPYYPHSGDPERAKTLLEEAGYGDGFELEYIIAQREGEERESLLIQDQLSEVGVDVQITTVEWSVLVDRLFSFDYEACRVGITQVPEPDTLVYQWYHSSAIGGMNFLQFSNEEMDNLLDAGRMEPDQDKRKEIYVEIATLVYELAPTVITYHELRATGYRAEIEGIKSHTSNLMKICRPSWGPNVRKN